MASAGSAAEAERPGWLVRLPCWQPWPMRCLLVVTLILIPLAAACGGPSAGALGGKSAQQVIALAEAAAAKEGSFHFLDETGTGTNAEDLSGDIGAVDAQEELKGPNGLLEVRLVDGTIYVNATASTLTYSLKLSTSMASAHAGQWIRLERTDAPYQTVAKTLGPAAELDDYVPVANLKVGSVSTLDGRNVLAISGTAPPPVSAHVTATLYVSTNAPFVPVGGTLSGTGAQKNEGEAVAFSAWGEAVHPSVPPGAVAYSSLVTS